VSAPRVVSEPEPAGLNDALLAFAAEAPKLHKDATGQVQNRTYGYATLDGVLDDVAPLLVKHALVWKVKATIADGQPAARWSMTHVPSGESDEDVMPLLGAVSPQTLGSALTYMRRYALVAYLNLAPGEDDDGAAASAPSSNRALEQRSSARPPAVSQPTARPAEPSQLPASAKQRALIEARARAADLTAPEFANVIKAAAGEPQTAWDPAAAQRWVWRALDRLPARLVDAVLAGIEAKA
jgi:hypothetical protein